MTEPQDPGPPALTPAPKLDPAAFALRARPRAVTRLSRRTLVLGTAGATAVVFGAVWWALGLHPLRFNNGQELYNTDARPGDALNGLPGSYADLTRPKPQPVPPAAVPQLGPPLPGDLGRPMLRQGALGPGVGPATDPAAVERERARQQAAGSGVFFTVSARQASTANPGQAVSTPSTGKAPEPGTAQQPLDADTAQNLQDRKQAFLSGRVDQVTYSTQRLQTPRSPYQLMAGTVIAAALVTGLSSDLPGEIIAQVSQNAYDTVTGRYLLVPQGTKLIGKYDSVVAYGQERVLLVWTRMILPDGSSIVLDNLPGTDTEGYAGLEDGVDYHTWQLIKGIALSTLLGIGSELASNSGTNGSNRIIVAGRDSADQAANQSGQRITSKNLAIQPTLTVRPGFPVRVLVNRDIVLKPYRG